jgi:hypothetical protein
MLNYSCYIKAHGKFQAELKVRYPVSYNKNRYGLDLYIFSPKVLSVDLKSYGISAFLLYSQSLSMKTAVKVLF